MLGVATNFPVLCHKDVGAGIVVFSHNLTFVLRVLDEDRVSWVKKGF